ncbi:ATP-binding protein [uncultured Alistipes sp.]|uniref:ATP-binding protein n=1 Tax=uncultured Alistipes sp. TaxID=538949 RepID=UPI00262202B8|nr:ATP-binding protein [uncultured Alistipes sp.]
MKTIYMPEIKRDDRIGSVFNSLFNIINICDCEDEIIFDFKDRVFFHPFFIAPLAIYCDTPGRRTQNINLNNGLQAYLSTIFFDSPQIITCASDVDNIIRAYGRKTYTPICKFLTDSADRDQIESQIQHLIEIQSAASGEAKMPLSYLFSELITNIVEHSQSKYGYIYSQYLNTEGCVDICIADNGVTILGSYIQANKYIDDIQGDPAEALRLAVGGFSTKNLPNTENRGYGISSSIRMLVEGLRGSFFILSGSAFYRHDKNGKTIVRLPDSIEWHGTIVLLRVPIKNLPADFNCYKYVE